jgi:hypothetical protein
LLDLNLNNQITDVSILSIRDSSKIFPFRTVSQLRAYAMIAAAMAATPAYPKALMLSAAPEEVAAVAPEVVGVEPLEDVFVDDPAEVEALDPEEAAAEEPELGAADAEEPAADEAEPDSPNWLALLEPTIPPTTP